MTITSEKAVLLVGSGDRAAMATVASERSDPSDGVPAAPKRRRGRPLLMSREAVIEKIRQLAKREEGIFRIHLTHSGLYARARRMFGSWSAAVEAAGVNYGQTLEHARGRALRTRKNRAARRRTAQET